MLGAINYTGNKESLLQEILPLFSKDCERVVDVCCGGLSVSLNTGKPTLANDINTNLIDMYKAMTQISLSDLSELVGKHKLSSKNEKEYEKLKVLYNTTKDPILLLLLQYHSFSNMIRFSDKGDFNVSFGKRKFNQNSIKKFLHFKNKCHNLTFSSEHYSNLDIKETDFVYIDPPYMITVASYNSYWSEKEEENLLKWIDNLDKRGIKFGLSNVTHHRGKSNQLLIDWSKKYKVVNLDKDYVFNQHHAKDIKLETKEVYIHN